MGHHRIAAGACVYIKYTVHSKACLLRSKPQQIQWHILPGKCAKGLQPHIGILKYTRTDFAILPFLQLTFLAAEWPSAVCAIDCRLVDWYDPAITSI